MDLFLYDYATMSSEVLVFGYDADGRKCEVYLGGFSINCHLILDTDYFDSSVAMHAAVEQIQYQPMNRGGKGQPAKRPLKDIIALWEQIPGQGFKGLCNDQSKLLRVHFKTFDHYESFKRAAAAFNEQVLGMQSQEVRDVSVQAVNAYTRFVRNTGQRVLRKAPIRMLEDDPANKYIYKLQRHHKFQVAGWNHFSEIHPSASNSKRRAFTASIEHICPTDREGAIPLEVMSWDIEVSTESGKFDSNAYNPNNRIVCICFTIGSAMSMGKSRRQVCIVPQHSRGSDTTDVILGEQGEKIEVVTVPDEVQMIQRFAQFVYEEDPAFITGFNESSFDWPFLRQKLEYYSDPEYYSALTKPERQPKAKHVQEFTGRLQGVGFDSAGRAYQGSGYRYATRSAAIFKSSDVKVTAGNTRKGICIDVPGIICIDTRTLLMKDQVLERRSLNEYLKANNLPLKLEVSFDDMNRAFKALVDKDEEDPGDEQDDTLTIGESLELSGLPVPKRNTAEQTLNRIYEYCVYDSDACRLLWAKRNLVYQQIEVCKLSFTPLRAGFLNANGIKVRNMVAAFAHDRGFSVPMATTSCDVRLRDKSLLDEYEKYPGAYVPEPHKGVSLTPVIALDFASLYPSIIMAHNLSPECVVEDKDITAVQSGSADSLYDTVTLRSGKTVQCNRVTVDFEKGFKRTQIIAHVLAREEGVGVYPFILQTLFNMRAQVKKVLEGIDESIKHLESNREANAQEIKDLLYQYSLVDAKQKAIKVFMNTFYGETGNQQSSLFDVVISGGTTSYGQKYIKQVHRAIGEDNCEVVAGDTDSIYFRPRASHYSFGPEGMNSTQMLEQANAIADKMRQSVNDMIGKQTHGFLKMAFEELLCPSVFTGKKKYFGAMYKPGDSHRQHIDVAVRGSVLVKGIDFIKSQYPDLIKRHGFQLINDILNLFNDRLKSSVDAGLFADETRRDVSGQLLDLCSSRALLFLNDTKSLKPQQYNQLSSKKRMRDATGGEMAGFRARLVPGTSTDPLAISIQQLQELNIPVPLVGEVLDIVYIRPTVFKRDLKSAQKMHILDFAVKTGQELDHTEYLKMFATSAIRISLAVRLPPNIDQLDPGSQSIQFSKAQKELKQHFAIDRLTAGVQTVHKTIGEVHRTRDVMDIQDTFTKSPVPATVSRVKETLSAKSIKDLVKSIKKAPEEVYTDALDYILDQVDLLDQTGEISALVKGSLVASELIKCITSQQDSRALFVIQKIDPDICERLQDIPDESVYRFVLLNTLSRVLQGKSANTPAQIAKMF